MAAPQVEVNCSQSIPHQNVRHKQKKYQHRCDKSSSKTVVCCGYLVEGDGAAGAAGVRHAAPAPAVLVVRAAADHVHVRRQVIELVPAALRGRADAGDEELEGTEQLAAVATARLSHEVDDAAAGDEVQGVFHEGEGVVREACAK